MVAELEPGARDFSRVAEGLITSKESRRLIHQCLERGYIYLIIKYVMRLDSILHTDGTANGRINIESYICLFSC